MTGRSALVSDETIDAWIASKKPEIIEAIKQLVRVRSVYEGFDASAEHPFGSGCAQAVDEAQDIIVRAGLQAVNHDYYGISAIYPGKSERKISFFSHLDVVPEGEGWTFDPYEPFEQDGFLFGRGARDNKAAAAGVIYTLQFFKEHHIPLKHTVSAFLGCNEEAGMQDVAYYLKEEDPAFSIVSDAFFPVGNGEKGILTADFIADIAGTNLLDFYGGELSNVIPGTARAILSGITPEQVQAALGEQFTVTPHPQGVVIEASGLGGHAAFPEGTINPIQKLAGALLRYELVTGSAARALAFIDEAFADYYGHGLRIAYEDEVSGQTTHTTGMVRLSNDKLTVNTNIRYAISAKSGEIVEKIRARGAEYGFVLEHADDNPPYHVSENEPIVQQLAALANSVLQTDQKPYVMGGATHARKLPRAVAFGPSRSDLSKPFPLGRGGPHQPDEAVRLQTIWDAMKVYIHALLLLDELVDNPTL
ncbi:Sapep family Mn(2+)-dependent dipeptidase [Paenibacillus eucommiae]|uniref:Succinyl-diaminopimelate desuccinylase n=1 Tax=Paenibacillus eucommiae TaxID=1355755 RepID=A0ABS4IVN9_9BACL|nr:Sapep family Mn(2+)-dependent dipeptidase [Paenibacillus eucommiae]MBP1991637.1 succinyl-diaminopimelate desuccinylase [Paenibacillus eucommiae]